MTRASALVAAALLASCKSTPPGSDAAVEARTAGGGAAEVPAASAAGAQAPAKPLAFSGTYEATPGGMHVPREGDVPNAAEWAGTKFRGDDAGVGRGPGTMAITVDAEGAVTGRGDGSLGPFSVVGRALGARVVGTLRGSGPEGFQGTFDLARAGTALRGDARVSDGEGRIVRALAITLEATATP